MGWKLLTLMVLTSGCAFFRADPGRPLRLPASGGAPLIHIETPTLQVNDDAEYCTRDEDVVDTVVFHHTDGSPFETVEDVNNSRLLISPDWYMMGYHFTISGPYRNPAINAPREVTVSQGRPFNITGAHLGVGPGNRPFYSPATPDVRRFLQIMPNAVMCQQGTRAATDTFNRLLNVKSHYTTVAIAIIGEYAPFHRTNEPTGYQGPPHQMSDAMLDASARLICELQRRYPNLRRVGGHRNYGFHPDGFSRTSCPGIHIENAIPEILRRARLLRLDDGSSCSFTQVATYCRDGSLPHPQTRRCPR